MHGYRRLPEDFDRTRRQNGRVGYVLIFDYDRCRRRRFFVFDITWNAVLPVFGALEAACPYAAAVMARGIFGIAVKATAYILPIARPAFVYQITGNILLQAVVLAKTLGVH